MNLNFRQLIETIGIFGVIASLVFVGMQLRLDRQVAMADQYFNRAESARADIRSELESDIYFDRQEELWDLGQRPSWWNESLQVAKQIRAGETSVRGLYYEILRARMEVIGMDNLYFQFRQGLLEEEFWAPQRERMKRQIANSEIRRNIFMNNNRPIEEVVNEIVEELRNENVIN